MTFFRLEHDNRKPHEIIPMSLNMQEVLNVVFYNICEAVNEKCYVQTRSQTITSYTNLPAAHCIDEGLEPNLKPEKQAKRSDKQKK